MALYEQTLSRILTLRVGILVGICIVSLFLSTTQAGQLAYAQKPLSKEILLQCQEIYPKYKELGEKDFKIKYSHKRFLEDCVKLYKDPNWTFKGKNTIDKNFEKTSSTKPIDKSNEQVTVKILGKSKISTDKYFVKFQACSENGSSNKSRFVIESQIEKFVGTSLKDIASKQCNSYWTQIKSKSSENILIKFTTDASVISTLENRPLL
jgi:hypothetical protein